MLVSSSLTCSPARVSGRRLAGGSAVAPPAVQMEPALPPAMRPSAKQSCPESNSCPRSLGLSAYPRLPFLPSSSWWILCIVAPHWNFCCLLLATGACSGHSGSSPWAVVLGFCSAPAGRSSGGWNTVQGVYQILPRPQPSPPAEEGTSL